MKTIKIFLVLTFVIVVKPVYIFSQTIINGYSENFTIGTPMYESPNTLEYSENFTIGTPMYESPNTIEFSENFTIDKPMFEFPNIAAYSSVFAMNEMGQYITGYSGLFTLDSLVGQIAGTIASSYDGSPISGASIKAVHNTTSISYIGQSEIDGTYEINSIPPGVYSVEATQSACVSQTKTDIAVNDGETTEVNFLLTYISPIEGMIFGTVTDAISIQAVEGAIVYAESGTMNFYSQPTNPNGEYEITLPFGYGYVLKAGAGNYADKLVGSVHVLEGEDPPEYSIGLSPLSGVYEVGDLKIDPNPVISTVVQGGVFHRYYLVSDQITGVDASGIEVEIESEGATFTVLSDENGMVDFSLRSDQIGSGEPNSSRQFNITKVDGQGIAEPIQFSCEVENLVYEKYWDNNQFTKLGGNLLSLNVTLEVEMGAVTTLVEEDNNNNEAEFIKVERQGRAGGGIGFKVKAPGAKAQLGPLSAGIGADAGVGSKFIGVTEDKYKYNHEISDDWEAVSQYILIADGNFGVLDGAMNRLLVRLQKEFSDYSSLDNAFVSDAVGLDVSVSAGAEAFVGVEATENIKLGAGANIGTEGHVTFNAVNHYLDNETEFNFGVSGNFAAGAEAGLKMNIGGNNNNDLKTMINIVDVESKRGMEFSLYLDQDNGHQLSKFALKYIRKHDLFEDEVVYTIDGEAALLAISGLTDEIQQLYEANVSGSSINVDDNTFKELTESVFDFLYQIQVNDDGDANISYVRNYTEITHATSVDFDLGLSATVAALELGGGKGFIEGKRMIKEQGKWIYGKRYVTQGFDGETPVIPESYKEVMQNIIHEVPLWLRASIGIVNFFAKPIWGKAKGDSTYFVGDNGSYIILPDSSFPQNIDSISCISWSWYGDAPSKKLIDVVPGKQSIYTSNKKQSEAIYGMQYGIGGFYQIEPYGTELADTAWLTILYTQEEADSLDESSLGMYWEDKSNHEWVFLGGILDTVNNTVTCPITELSMFTLAPAMPYGKFGLHAVPDSIYADSISVAAIVSDTIFNNNHTPVTDGEMFTVSTSLGNIVNVDADTSLIGNQVQVVDSKIQFGVRSSHIGGLAKLSAFSVNGSASASTMITYFDTIAPLPPVLISCVPDSTTAYLSWQPNIEDDIAGYVVYFDTDTIAPFEGIHTVFGRPSPIYLGTDTTYNVRGLFNDTTYYFTMTAIDVVGNESGYSNFVQVTPLDGITLEIKVYLEGPFNGTEMSTSLNPENIPAFQPYSISPWNYTGFEKFLSIPNSNITDWVIVELRETTGDVYTADIGSVISRQAAFVLNNGNLIERDGLIPTHFNVSVTNNLYVVIRHRNHLPIMSAIPLTETNGVYTYDFTDVANKAFGETKAQTEIATGVWGMMSSDADADGQIDNIDKNDHWLLQNGASGYLESDFDMNGSVNSLDKDKWMPNSGKGTQVPE